MTAVTTQKKIQFLKSHETYSDDNYNVYYSRNVKIPRFVPPALQKKALLIVEADDFAKYFETFDIPDNIEFRGRSSGHAVLADVATDGNKNDVKDVDKRYRAVKKFDEQMKRIRTEFIRFVETHRVVPIKVKTVTREVQHHIVAEKD